MEIRRVARGASKDARQQNYERKRKDERKEEEEKEKEEEKERGREENSAGMVGVERKDSLYNPRNTGCSNAAYTYKGRKWRADGWPLITA